MIDPLRGRVWNIVNPSGEHRRRARRLQAPAPRERPSLSAPEAEVAKRAGVYARKHLWVTRYDPRERHAAGDYPNQHPGGAGLPSYVQDDAPLDNTDVVVWYTFGTHHIVRPEDWPVMPVAYIGFMLKPVGFFDRNPALDVPRPTKHGGNGHGGACCHSG